MKLNELVTMRPAIEKIASKEMEPIVALAFAKFLRKVLGSVQEFEIKRAELFQTYGEFAGDGEDKRMKILPENEEVFNNAIKEELDKDVEVPTFDIVNLGVIGLAPIDIINIVGLFK